MNTTVFQLRKLFFYRKIARLLFLFRGGQRIAEWIRIAHTNNPLSIVINDFDGDLKFACELNEHMGSQIFWRGYYSEDQLNLLDRLLKPESIFLDIGANYGEFTLFAAKRCVKGKVVSFEPVKSFFAKLAKNVEINGFKNTILINKGLSDRHETIPIFTSEDKFTDNTIHCGLPSIYQTEQRSTYIENIEVIPLTDIKEITELNTIDVMKIDVEGAELAALKGAEAVIKKYRPIIFIEIGQDTCKAGGYDAKYLVNYLKNLGYRLEIIGYKGKTSLIKDDSDICVFQNVICYPDLKN